MGLTGFVVVAVAASAALGWYNPFEGTSAAFMVAVFLLGYILLSRAKARGGDDDDAYPDEKSRMREFVFGVGIGAAWVVLTFLAISALRITPVYGLFVDKPGESIVRDLETLARNDAWSSIVKRSGQPLPAHIRPAAQAAIDRLHYLALAHSAASIGDPEQRCNLQRDAESFANEHRIDSLSRIPFTCVSPPVAITSTTGASLRLLKRDLDPAGRTVLTLLVLGYSGAPLTGLAGNNFVAVAEAREVGIANVTYAPSELPSRRFVVVTSRMRSRQHNDLAQSVHGMLTGLVGGSGRTDSFDAADTPLFDALTQAANRFHGESGAVILLAEAEEPLSAESVPLLISSLRKAHAPLHLILFGDAGTAPNLLAQIARDSGGSYHSVKQGSLTTLRNALAPPLADEGTYFVTLNGRFPRATIALSSSRAASK
jgi:hypothetical protein